MRRFQTDPGSPRADAFVPLLLEIASRSTIDSVKRAATLLAEWSRTYRVDDQRAILFEYTMTALAQNVWDELQPNGMMSRGPGNPNELALLALLSDSASAWWDRRDTPSRETRDQIVAVSLTSALERAVTEHGEPDSGGWAWGAIRNANIAHVLRIPDWSANVPVQGGPSTLAPLSGGGGFGPSWRMVVELAPQVRAWGIYPGGQSGNPASSRYRDRVHRWSNGRLDTLRVPRSTSDLQRVSSRLTLTARGE
jgi:penicillin amidase